MAATKTRLVVLAGGATAVAGTLIVSSVVSGSEPQRAVIGDPLVSKLEFDAGGLADATQLPIMPLDPIVDVYEGYKIVIARYGGLESVRAELNGVSLKSESDDETFVLTVGALDGTGPATLLLTETFAGGGTVTLPYTVFVGDHTSLAPASPPADTSAEPLWTRALAFGSGDGEVGFIAGNEAMAVTPAAIAPLADGRIAILDTANQRVIAVAETGEATTLVSLPSGSYASFASTPDRSSIVAIDFIRATGVDIVSGEQVALPEAVRMMSSTTNYSLDAAGNLYVTNPGDGVQYSVGTAAGGTESDGVLRQLDAARVVVNNDVGAISIQTSADATPVDIPVAGDDLSILDHITLADGRIVALVAVETAGSWSYQLLVTDGTASRTVPVTFDGRFIMTSYLAAVDDGVVVANPTAESFTLTAYAV